MPVFAGHPETAIHIAMVGLIMAVFIWAFPLEQHARRFSIRFLLDFTLVGLLALRLASIQMIPTLEWVKQVPNPFGEKWPPLSPYDLLALVSEICVERRTLLDYGRRSLQRTLA